MVPIAVIAANIEPQKAAKKPIARIIAIPKPPGQCPTKVTAKCTNRDAAPPLHIAMPAKIKSGTATKTCFVTEPNATCIRLDQGRFNSQIATLALLRPNTMNTGTDEIRRTVASVIAKTFIWSSGIIDIILRTSPKSSLLQSLLRLRSRPERRDTSTKLEFRSRVPLTALSV